MPQLAKGNTYWIVREENSERMPVEFVEFAYFGRTDNKVALFKLKETEELTSKKMLAISEKGLPLAANSRFSNIHIMEELEFPLPINLIAFVGSDVEMEKEYRLGRSTLYDSEPPTPAAP